MSALERVRVELTAARRRGEAFGPSWGAALAAARPDPLEMFALVATRVAWEAAYLREPDARPSMAAALLGLDESLSGPEDEAASTAPTVADRQRVAAERETVHFIGAVHDPLHLGHRKRTGNF